MSGRVPFESWPAAGGPYGRAMARLTEDDFAALRARSDRDSARTLGGFRRADGAQRNEATLAWLAAGDTLAEKAIAALDAGDEQRASRLVRRIIDLPVVDDDLRSGLTAVGLLLDAEVLAPGSEAGIEPDVWDGRRRLLPGLEPSVAAELRRALATATWSGAPSATARGSAAAASPERPFSGVQASALPAAVAGVLRLVLRLRAAG